MNVNSILYFAAAIAVLSLHACSKDDIAAPGNTAPYTISASIDNTHKSRISMEDNNTTAVELKWKSTDKIYVVNSSSEGSTSNNTLFTFTVKAISADGKTASFTCPNYPVGATPAYALHQGESTHSTFNPASAIVYFNYIVAPDDLGSLADGFPLYAQPNSAGVLEFRPALGMLKLDITLPPTAEGEIMGLRIATKDRSRNLYNGEVSFSATGSVPQKLGTANVNQIQFSPLSAFQLPADKHLAIYLLMPPGNELAGKDLEIDLQTGSKLYTTAIRGAGIESGKCYPLKRGADKWSEAAFFTSGTGTSTDPYLISTGEQLRTLSRIYATTTDMTPLYFKLQNDIQLTTTEADPWMPIGRTNSELFYGDFDGGGHVIRGDLYLTDKDQINSGSYEYCFGLFGDARGRVSNLTHEGNVVFNGTETGGQSFFLYLGAIAAKAARTMTSCRHIGSVTCNAPNWTATIGVGGIAGFAKNSSASSSNFIGCTQTGTDSKLSVNAPKSGAVSIGGIVGEYAQGRMHTSRSETNIEATINATSSTVYFGALAGYKPDASARVYSTCSTFPGTLTIFRNGAQQMLKACGYGTVTTTAHTD